VEIARKKYTVPNNKDAYEPYLKKYMNVKVTYTNEEGKNKRYTVEDICTWQGTYVIAIAGHLTTVVDGNVYDIWDCSGKSAYKIWKIR